MDYIIREICIIDYTNGYMELMYEFSNYCKHVSEEEFAEYIGRRDRIQIWVIIDNESQKVIGAGTIFKMEKLHNNPMGQIEDVIITEQYRKYGFGKKIIERLAEVGLTDFNCYKVILNCLDKNIGFYEKCGFAVSCVQMRKTEYKSNI